MDVPRHECDDLFTVACSHTPTLVDIVNIGVDMLIDTGASVNVIDSSTYDWMRGWTS